MRVFFACDGLSPLPVEEKAKTKNRLRSAFPLPVDEKAISRLSRKPPGVLGGSALDGLSTLPVEEKPISRLSRNALGVLGGSARGDLFSLPVEEKAVSKLPRKVLGVRGGSARYGLFTLPVKEKAISRLACDGFSPLPVEEKAISWTWCALAMAFSTCLSRKRPSHVLKGYPKGKPKVHKGRGARARDGGPRASEAALPLAERRELVLTIRALERRISNNITHVAWHPLGRAHSLTLRST